MNKQQIKEDIFDLVIPDNPNYTLSSLTGSIRRKDYLEAGGRKEAQAAHKKRKRERARRAKRGEI